MKTLVESILKSTGTGKDGFVLNYIKNNSKKRTTYSGIDSVTEYLIKPMKIDSEGKVNIPDSKFTSLELLVIQDENSTKLPVKFNDMGCPMVLSMPALSSCEGFPEMVKEYFKCENNKIVEYDYLPYIRKPLWGNSALSIGGPCLRRITCDYRGDTMKGNSKVYIYADFNMPEDEFNVLLDDIQTHFAYRSVIKGKFEVIISDTNNYRNERRLIKH